MRLFEFKTHTTDPQTLLQKIADDIEAAERIDCHGQCASAIRKGQVNDADIVVIVGPKGSGGKIGFHSIIIDSGGNIKVDSYADKMVEYDRENGIFYYDTGKAEPMPMTYKTYAKVGDLKTM